MSIVVSGLGIVSSLGIGVEENLSQLYSGQSGISLCPEILITNNKLPVGEIRYSNEQLKEKLGISANKVISRTALLGMLAVKEAIIDSQIDVTSYKIGLISSTSVGGMDQTEIFFKGKHSKKCTFYTLRFGCSFAAVNTIKPQLL